MSSKSVLPVIRAAGVHDALLDDLKVWFEAVAAGDVALSLVAGSSLIERAKECRELSVTLLLEQGIEVPS